MQRYRVLYIVIILLFSKAEASAFGRPALKISVDKDRALIGTPVHLEITVKTGGNIQVSWQLCNYLFQHSQQIALLAIDSGKEAGYSRFRVIFTCLKPIPLSVNSLPVLIDHKQFLTPAFKINFENDRSLLMLRGIKPVEGSSWLYPLISFSKVFLLLLVLIIILIVVYFNIKTRMNAKAIAAIKQNCFEKLTMLQLDTERASITAKDLVVEISALLFDNFEVDIFNPNRQGAPVFHDHENTLLREIHIKAHKLRFLPQPAATLLCPIFLNMVREYIATAQFSALKPGRK